MRHASIGAAAACLAACAFSLPAGSLDLLPDCAPTGLPESTCAKCRHGLASACTKVGDAFDGRDDLDEPDAKRMRRAAALYYARACELKDHYGCYFTAKAIDDETLRPMFNAPNRFGQCSLAARHCLGGSLRACYIASLCTQGAFAPPEEQRRWLSALCTAGHAPSCELFGRMFFTFSKSGAFLESACKAGRHESCFMAAVHMELGADGRRPDPTAASALFTTLYDTTRSPLVLLALAGYLPLIYARRSLWRIFDPDRDSLRSAVAGQHWKWIGRFGLCSGASGLVTRVDVLTSTGLPSLDSVIASALRSWHVPSLDAGRCWWLDFTIDSRLH